MEKKFTTSSLTLHITWGNVGSIENSRHGHDDTVGQTAVQREGTLLFSRHWVQFSSEFNFLTLLMHKLRISVLRHLFSHHKSCAEFWWQKLALKVPRVEQQISLLPIKAGCIIVRPVFPWSCLLLSWYDKMTSLSFARAQHLGMPR
jgi:hypothetical protein